MTCPRLPRSMLLRGPDTKSRVISPCSSGSLASQTDGRGDGWGKHVSFFLKNIHATPVLPVTRSEETILWASVEYNFYIDQIKIGA